VSGDDISDFKHCAGEGGAATNWSGHRSPAQSFVLARGVISPHLEFVLRLWQNCMKQVYFFEQRVGRFETPKIAHTDATGVFQRIKIISCYLEYYDVR
jgi:hypothetical protein